MVGAGADVDAFQTLRFAHDLRLLRLGRGHLPLGERHRVAGGGHPPKSRSAECGDGALIDLAHLDVPADVVLARRLLRRPRKNVTSATPS